jgi:hypothetical protein
MTVIAVVMGPTHTAPTVIGEGDENGGSVGVGIGDRGEETERRVEVARGGAVLVATSSRAGDPARSASASERG